MLATEAHSLVLTGHSGKISGNLVAARASIEVAVHVLRVTIDLI